MTENVHAALWHEMKGRGVFTPADFKSRFGVDFASFTAEEALALLCADETPRQPDGPAAPLANSAAVSTLGEWLVSGQLDALPDPVPGFPDALSRYRDRTLLITFTRQILACAPWSLTGEERAAQFVAVLTPLITSEAT